MIGVAATQISTLFDNGAIQEAPSIQPASVSTDISNVTVVSEYLEAQSRHLMITSIEASNAIIFGQTQAVNP